MDQLIKPSKVAEICGLPERTFQRWVTDGTIREECIFNPPGKRIRLRLPMLLKYHSDMFPADFLEAQRSD